MDVQTLSQVIINSQTVVEMICTRCAHARSRRGGLVVNIEGREKFLCAPCLDHLEEQTHRDYLRANWGGSAA